MKIKCSNSILVFAKDNSQTFSPMEDITGATNGYLLGVRYVWDSSAQGYVWVTGCSSAWSSGVVAHYDISKRTSNDLQITHYKQSGIPTIIGFDADKKYVAEYGAYQEGDATGQTTETITIPDNVKYLAVTARTSNSALYADYTKVYIPAS